MTGSNQVFRKYLLAALTVAALFKPIAPIFETTSNASQFVNLENLIGSLHTYASEDAQLLVRDLGLTSGQRSLLERYQNVQFVSATYSTSENTRFISVENELISVDDRLTERKASADLLYVDSIRKRCRLAVVFPFMRSQIDQLMAQLNMSDAYQPCRRPYESVDLIFYHNEAPSSPLETIVRQIKFVNKCYKHILFLAANLADDENFYPRRIAVMLLKLILEADNNLVALRTHGYTHFFLVEPNRIPIHSFWLDAVFEQVTEGYCQKSYCVTSWWISRSIYRGLKSTDQRFHDRNGNALYHLSSRFAAYVERFSTTYLFKAGPLLGYDLSNFRVLFNNSDLSQELWHKFRVLEFIQNCGRSSCQGATPHDKKLFHSKHLHPFIIHGDFHQKYTAKKRICNLQCTVILSIIFFLLILLWNQLCRRRLKVIQTLHCSFCAAF